MAEQQFPYETFKREMLAYVNEKLPDKFLEPDVRIIAELGLARVIADSKAFVTTGAGRGFVARKLWGR